MKSSLRRCFPQAFFSHPMLSALLFLLLLAGITTTAAAQTAQAGGTVTLGSGFSAPNGVAVDGSGNVFVADYGNNAVNEIVAAGGYTTVNTLGSGFLHPGGVAVDGSGNVFVADYFHSAVKEIVAAGGYTTVNTLGSGFNGPYGVAVDGSGNVFVADSGNNAVKEIVAAGGYTTVNNLGSGFSGPSGVAVDGSGNVFVADYSNNAVKEIVAAGGYTTVNILGSGFSYPEGVAVDGSGNVFVADSGNNAVKEIVAASGYTTVNTLGSGFSNPLGVTVDGSGNVFVADFGHSAVKEIVGGATNFHTINMGTTSTSFAIMFTVTGSGTFGTPAVLTQGATGLDFAYVSAGSTCSGALTSGTTCTVNVTFTPKAAGARNGAVELTSSTGAVLATAYIYGTGVGPQVTFQQPGQTPVTLGSGFNGPLGVAVDGSGNVFVADAFNNAVKEIVAAGGYTTVNILGSGFSGPSVVAVDGSGNVFVADTNNNAVKEIVAAGGYTTVNTLGSGFNTPQGVAVDGSGNVFVADTYNSAVKEIVAAGGYTTVNTLGSGFKYPQGVAVDGSGNVFVADNFNDAVKEIVAAGGYTTVNTLGSGFSQPTNVAVDSSGNVFVADFGNYALKEIVAAGGYTTVNTLGSGFSSPASVAVDGSGNVFVADYGDNTVKELTFATPPSLNFATATAVGSTDSADGLKTVIVANIGNAGLVLPPPTSGTNASIAAGFTLGNSGTCPQLGLNSSPYTLAAGSSCTYMVGFTPVGAGTNNGSLILTDNNLNIAGSTQSVALTGTGIQPAEMVSPASGTTLTGSSATFTWSSDIGVAATQILIGKVPGHHEYGGLAPNTGSSYTIANLPVDGRTLYVTLQSRINNQWVTNSYTYTAYTAIPDPAAASGILSPVPSSILTGSTATFTWSAGTGVAATQILIGKVPGHHEYGGLAPNTGSSYTVTNLPVDGRTLYVTLQSRMNNQWVTKSYTYTAYTAIPDPAAASTILSPAPSSIINGSTATFTWSTGTGVAATQILIGKVPGHHEYGGLAPNTGSSYTVTNLPTDGRTLYVTLQSRMNNQWVTKSYTYTAKAATTITTPPTASALNSGQTLAASNLTGGVASTPGTFAWTTPTIAPAAGTASYSVTFTPTDTATYSPVTTNVTITTSKATPTVSAPPTASALHYPQALSASTLTGGGASTPGTFAWTTPTIAPAAGTASYSVTFTPTDTATYSPVTTNVTVTTSKATPTVSAPPTASALHYPHALSASTLTGGGASTNGSFYWTHPDQVPSGSGSYSVTFTPNDTIDFNTVDTSVNVTVKGVPTGGGGCAHACAASIKNPTR